MKIIHLSDLHVSAANADAGYLRNLLKSVAAKKPDHIVVSGDLTTCGSDAEYSRVAEIFDEQKLFRPELLTVIPGNHDMYPCLFDVLPSDTELYQMSEYPSTIPSVVAKILRIINNLRRYQEEEYGFALQRFDDFFGRLYEGALSFGNRSTGGFPFVKLIDDVALVCVDSNYLSPIVDFTATGEALSKAMQQSVLEGVYSFSHNPFCSNGWVDDATLAQSLSLNAIHNAHKIVLMHHYLYSHQTVARRVGEWFAKSMAMDEECRQRVCRTLSKHHVDLVLHGHWHLTEEYWVAKNRLRVLNGGGLREGNYYLIEANGRMDVRAVAW